MSHRAENSQGTLAFPVAASDDPQRPYAAAAPVCSAPNEPVLACEDNLSFMSRMGDGQVKLVVTSPPYNIGKDYEDRLTLADYLEKQASRHPGMRAGAASPGVDLLAGRQLR